jgi:16S rRNA (uracil1498-N3)-methyltransferase
VDDRLRRSAAHVVVTAEALDDGTGATLEAADHHHLAAVLRLRPGEAVTATDGAGRWRPYRWTGAGLAVDGAVVDEPAPAPAVTVGFAPTKGDRPEWTVQKLTELGVDEIVVLRAERSVVRWEGGRAAQAVSRLERVAREAAMQSRRCHVPHIRPPTRLADVAGAAIAEPGGMPPSLDHPVVLVGPEGGWSERELALELPRVALGPLVLRAETAALAAAVLLTSLRHRMVATEGGQLSYTVRPDRVRGS